MVKVLLKTLFAFLSICAGFYLAYLYVKGIDGGSNPLLLLPATFLVVMGIFFLMRASKTSVPGVAKPNNPSPKDPTIPHQGFADILKRNDEIASKWASTAQLKDKLKVMQISAEEKISE